MRFGTDGIRAKEECFTREYLGKIAQAVYSCYGKIEVCLARDTRISGKRILDDLKYWLGIVGIKVYDLGVAPTPTLAYMTKIKGCMLGIMVSASHNPPEYNGLKFFTRRGAKLSEMEEKRLERAISACYLPQGREKGVVSTIDTTEYENWLKSLVGARFKGMRVGLDLCYGATTRVAKRIFEDLGCRVYAINEEGNGEKINVDCGATCLVPLLDIERKKNVDIAFAYDGDGDRAICVKGGKIYDGDQLLYALFRYLSEHNLEKNEVVVGTLNSNLGLEKALENRGVEFIRAGVGDKFVYDEMVNRGANLGGESSGHIIVKKYAETGDGILVSLLVALLDRERGLDCLSDLVLFPKEEREIIVNQDQMEEFKNSKSIKQYLREQERGDLRVVVRASGTEPKIRVMVESERYESAREKAEEIQFFLENELLKQESLNNNKNAIKDAQICENSIINCDKLAKRGVRILCPEKTYVESSVEIGEGSVVHPFCVLRGNTKIGKNVTIYPFCDLTDTTIGDGADLRSTYAIQAEIGEGATVGPFTTLRKGAIIGKECRVGDYVEVKNSTLGDGVKVAHLAYVGDAVVGSKTNVGCGTVFANYNGKIKRKTEVGERVFIGCNANLIAPLNIGDDVFIAGGTTVTRDVPSGKFVISRCEQETLDRR